MYDSDFDGQVTVITTPDFFGGEGVYPLCTMWVELGEGGAGAPTAQLLVLGEDAETCAEVPNGHRLGLRGNLRDAPWPTPQGEVLISQLMAEEGTVKLIDDQSTAGERDDLQ